MYRTLALFVLATLVALLAGCMTYSAAEMSPRAVAAEASMDGFASSAPGAGGSFQQRQLIRTASIDLEVDAITDAADAIEALATELGGYVESRNTGDKHGSVTMRVPADKLDGSLERLSEIGHETERRNDAVDVTEQLADLSARLETNRALRDRLRELLGRAKGVEEVLAVETQLTRLQAEIDSQEGRLERMREQVALSSVTVHLERPVVLGPLGYVGHGLWWVLKKLFVLSD